MSFNATAVCAKFAEGQFEIFAAGNETAVSAEIVLAVPSTAAPKLENTVAVAGKVVVIQRGATTFYEKALQAQAAGAVGAIIVNNVLGDPFTMPGDFSDVKIPVVMVPISIKAALDASAGLHLTISAPGNPQGLYDIVPEARAHAHSRTRPAHSPTAAQKGDILSSVCRHHATVHDW